MPMVECKKSPEAAGQISSRQPSLKFDLLAQVIVLAS
jgi:hypothetical protein